MPIVSSRTGMDVMQADGTRKVHWYFTDQTGKEYPFRMRGVPTDFDVAVEMPLREASYNEKLFKWERRRIEADVEAGIPVGNLVLHHLTARQSIKHIVTAFMSMPPNPEAVATAEWIRDNVGDAVIDADLSRATRTRVRSRITGLIAMKSELEADSGRIEGLR